MSASLYEFAADEAGDVSLRFEHGASRHFVIALVGTREADQVRRSLAGLRSQCHLPADFEFKFHWLTNRRLRDRLWHVLSPLNYQIWALVVHKAHLPDTIRIMPPRTFYVYFASEALRMVPESLRGEHPYGLTSLIVQARLWQI